MKKLYEKNELVFAIIWIVAYCVICGTVRGNFGDDSPIMLAALALFTAGILFFIKLNHLEKKYGLCGIEGKASDYLFFIPAFILMTGNLWGGFGIAYDGVKQVFAVVSMALVGFVEEMIFRGFLFRYMLRKDPAPVAISVCVVTFGVGHIVNLLTGQASLETVIQIVFAIAWGFLLTFLFYKTGSLVISVIVHSLVDVFSIFSNPSKSVTTAYVYVGATIVVSAAYCIYLSRKKTRLERKG